MGVEKGKNNNRAPTSDSRPIVFAVGQGGRSSRWASLAAGAIIVGAAVLVYSNTWHVPFLFDDETAIVTNQTIRSLWPIEKALLPPTGGEAVQRRPVVNLSLAINYAISGLNVWSYHAMNLAAHIASGLLLLGIVRRTLLSRRFGNRFATAAAPLAALVALLWTVHPLLTEAVTYTIQRTEVLAGMFYLLTLYCVIRGDTSRRRVAWNAAAVAACLLAVGSKEAAVSAPLMVLLYDRIFLSASWGDVFRRRKSLYAGLACTWILVIVLLPRGAEGTAVFGRGQHAIQYALAQCGVVAHYLRLCFWPHPLIVDYGYYTPQTAGQIVPYALLMAGLLVATAAAFRRQPWLGFLGVWFFAILAPSSSVVPLFQQIAAEKRMYLPLAAVVTAVVLGTYLLSENLLVKRLPIAWRRPLVLKWIGFGAAGLIAATLGCVSFVRNRDYRSELSIWENTVRQCPGNGRAHDNLGVALVEQRRIGEGIAHYREALRINPRDVDAHINYGSALVSLGRVDEAIAQYQEVLKINPNNAAAQSNYGLALAGLGQIDEAIAHYREALRIDPHDASAHNNYGLALAGLGQIDEAIAHYRKALRLNPDLAMAHSGYGMALAERGQIGEAIAHCLEALKLSPKLALAHNSYGMVLMKGGQIDEAIAQYREALKLDPKLALAHNGYGMALVKRGQIDEAIPYFRKALELKPQFVEAHNNLGMALISRGRIAEATTEFEKALRINPGLAEAHNNLGMALARGGRIDEAAVHFRKAVEIQPEYAAARRNLDIVLQMKNSGPAPQLPNRTH